jgi:hypothetical protein
MCLTNAQVLPPDVMLLAEPSPEELLAAVEAALTRLPCLDPQQQHERVSMLRQQLPLREQQHKHAGSGPDKHFAGLSATH